MKTKFCFCCWAYYVSHILDKIRLIIAKRIIIKLIFNGFKKNLVSRCSNFNFYFKRIKQKNYIYIYIYIKLPAHGSFEPVNHTWHRLWIWIADALPTYLITYTFDQMQSASFHNELFAIWAISLLIFFGNADCICISAYSLEDNENRRRYNMEVGLLFLLGILFVQDFR